MEWLRIEFLHILSIAYLSYPIIGVKRASVVITDIKCENFDHTYFKIKNCSLAGDSGNTRVINGCIQPLKTTDNIWIKLVLMRKVRKSYQPFFLETTVNFCGFLKDHKHQIPWGIIYDRITVYTNINHSCPYNHDMILKDFKINTDDFAFVPLPNGQYTFVMKVLDGKILKLKVQFYFQKTI
ncbi:uncharacterized protein LOC142235295 [Haematobia irritans]|uniref:uncharacterized protein LOC142235295 n=1 Tax=Haematobia irritans TaxID=7368 RepID=UPI003F508CA2